MTSNNAPNNPPLPFHDLQETVDNVSKFEEAEDSIFSTKVKSDDEGRTEEADEKKMKRRQRNRVLAQEARKRKKMSFESLQMEVQDLAHENLHLKSLAKSLNPNVCNEILSNCCSELPKIIESDFTDNGPAKAALTRADPELISVFGSNKRSFYITDPTLPDNPIIYASPAFTELTGYNMDEVLGRNCRFLQGPGTDPECLKSLRSGMEDAVDVSVLMLNYRKDGSPFWNHTYVSPLFNINHDVVNYVGVQVEIHSPIQHAHLNDGGDRIDSGDSSSMDNFSVNSA